MSREARLVLGVFVAIGLLVVCVPTLTAGVMVVAGAVTMVGMRSAVVSTVQADRGREVFRELAALQRGVQRQADLGNPLAPCHDEAWARAQLAPDTKYAVAPDDCLVTLGLSPDPLYGRYWVEVDAAGAWRLGGVIDVDADGEAAEAELLPGGEPHWVTVGVY